MENIIFIVLIVGSYILRFLIKKSKEGKQGEGNVNNNQISRSSSSEDSDFDITLTQFSNHIGQELRSEPLTVKKEALQAEKKYKEKVSDPLEKKAESNRSINYQVKKRKSNRMVSQFKTKKSLQDLVIASEILKTKF